MSAYSFPGFTTFLATAAGRIGRPEAEAPARRITTLSSLANLCAQAGAAGPEDARAILAKAAEFRDQLRVAYEAAELMLFDVHRALGLENQTMEPVLDLPRKKILANNRTVLTKRTTDR